MPTQVAVNYEARNAVVDLLRKSLIVTNPRLIITEQHRVHSLNSLLGIDQPILAVDTIDDDGISLCQDFHEAEPNDIALLMMTSGSTGVPKAVSLTHENIISSLHAKIEALGLDESVRSLNWVAFDHVAGLVDLHFLPLILGGAQIHIGSELIISSPSLFLSLCSAHEVDLTFAPSFLLDLLSQPRIWHQDSAEYNLSKLKVLISGGEGLTHSTAARFSKLAKPYGLSDKVIHPAFGMTETCAGCAFNTAFEPSESVDFACLGEAITGLNARIVSNAGEILPPGQPGELQVKGPMVTRGYYNNRAANQEAFTADGWFRTGDLAVLSDSSISLVGRSKDIVIINGVNYSCAQLEAALKEVDGMEQLGVTVVPTRSLQDVTEKLVVFVHIGGNLLESITEAELIQLVRTIRDHTILQWGTRPLSVVPLQEATIERSSLGKLSRNKLRKSYEEGLFQAQLERVRIAEKNFQGEILRPASEMEEQVLQLYSEVLEMSDSEISTHASFFDLGGTSLSTIQIHSRLIEFIGFEFPLVTLLQNPSIASISTWLERHQEYPSMAQGDDSYNPLVPLQVTGDKPPLFCVHPGVGEILVFVNWSKHFINKRPFHALRARGFEPGESHFITMDEMVEIYTQAIVSSQPKGPYSVAGYSYGGIVAFEIAKSLEKMGETVEFCGLINIPPNIKPRMLEINFTDGLLNLSMFLELVLKEDIPDLQSMLSPMSDEDQVSYIVSHAPASRVIELNMDANKLMAWVGIAGSLINCGRAYDPSGVLKGDLTVFYADPLRGTKSEWLDILQDWKQYVSGSIRYIEVPGAHYTLMSKAHLPAFAKIFHEAMITS